jgi:hypothetical protein
MKQKILIVIRLLRLIVFLKIKKKLTQTYLLSYKVLDGLTF